MQEFMYRGADDIKKMKFLVMLWANGVEDLVVIVEGAEIAEQPEIAFVPPRNSKGRYVSKEIAGTMGLNVSDDDWWSVEVVTRKAMIFEVESRLKSANLKGKLVSHC
jgi:hypothetical protein